MTAVTYFTLGFVAALLFTVPVIKFMWRAAGDESRPEKSDVFVWFLIVWLGYPFLLAYLVVGIVVYLPSKFLHRRFL